MSRLAERPASIRVSYRGSDGVPVDTTLDQVAVADLAAGLPVGECRSYKGCRHYSGWYWSATMGQLVAYESRLELAASGAGRWTGILWVDRSPNPYTDTAAVRAWSGRGAAGAGDRQADSAGGPRAGINEGRLATGAPGSVGITASRDNTPVMLP